MSGTLTMREIFVPDADERERYAEVTEALVLPGARLVAADGATVTLPPVAVEVLSAFTTLLATGQTVRVTISNEAEAARVRYHLDILTQQGQEMGGYDPIETHSDVAGE